MTNDTTGTAAQSSKPAKKEAVVAASQHEPIVIDMGKKNRKQVRKLRRGNGGRLLNRVEDILEHLSDNNALSGKAQPIVVVVKEKKKKRRGGKRIARMWGLR